MPHFVRGTFSSASQSSWMSPCYGTLMRSRRVALSFGVLEVKYDLDRNGMKIDKNCMHSNLAPDALPGPATTGLQLLCMNILINYS